MYDNIINVLAGFSKTCKKCLKKISTESLLTSFSDNKLPLL